MSLWNAARSRLFRLAEAAKAAQLSGRKEEPMHRNPKVSELLGSAAGAAEAMQDCGVETDDTELVANFIGTMDGVHATFVRMSEAHPDVPPGRLLECVQVSMRFSPAGTNAWFLWRLACVIRHMAHRDLVDAAREVVRQRALQHSSMDTAPLDKALAKLAAALPKEAE